MRTRTLAPLVAAAFVLGGCSAEAEPEPIFAQPEPTASPSPAGEPKAERESVRQFLIRWAEEERDMQNTGQTASYRVTVNGCEMCTELADRVDDIYAAGGHIETEGMGLGRVVERERGRVRFWVDTAPTEYVERAGGSAKTLPGGRVHYRAELKRVGNEWGMTFLIQEAQ